MCFAADYELAQLQERLKETEMAVEKIVSKMGSGSDEMTNVTTEQEQKLLQQLKEITRVMKEGKLIDSFSPETEAEEDPYMEDWEGYPEEMYHTFGKSECRCQQDIAPDSSGPYRCSAEELEDQVEAEATEGFSNETVTKQSKEREYQAMGQKKGDSLRLGEQSDVLQCDENNAVVEESQSGNCQELNQASKDMDRMENTGLSLEDCSDKAQEAFSAKLFASEPRSIVKGTDRLRKRNKKVME
uniref:Resistance to inhibitors of cholinesterase 3-like protein n=1 Tax=Callorhinchus milii TaxID=7868 RepID=V9KKZ7_CALMI